MDLNEYIRQSYKRPNRRVLETLGASEDLIEYLMETPGNTNWNIVESIGSSSGEITLPYTFHFELREIEYEGETYEMPQCTEMDKFVQVIDSFGNGWIPSFEVANYRQFTYNQETEKQELGEIQEFIPTEFTYVFAYAKYGDEEGREINYMLVGKNTLEEQLSFECGYEEGFWEGESTGDIIINKQNGYIIKVINHVEGENKGQTYIEHEEDRYYIKSGESCTVPGEPSETPRYTDGTNNYFGGEVITPTSDITLTVINS